MQLVDENERFAFRVPCPAVDLIHLACWDEGDPSSLARLLRINPALLLFSLIEFRNFFGEPPVSGEELVTWAQRNLVRRVAHSQSANESGFASDTSVHSVCFRGKRRRLFFRDFLRARSNSKLRKMLCQFLKQGVGLSKPDRKRFVSLVLGAGFRADDLNFKRIRRQKLLARVVDQWQQGIGPSVDVENLIRVAADLQSLKIEFEDRLQEEKLASMKQLAYGASHEINNPLANIATRAQTMMAHELQPDKQYQLSVIYEQAIRAHEMISDMMLFAHPPAIERADVSLRLLMAKIVNELKPLFEKDPRIDCVVTMGPGVDRADVDPVHLSVAIKNLIRNSAEAIRSLNRGNGRIEIRVAPGLGARLEFSVWDNGIGITGDVARHLFDPFYSGREAGRGLGLGLSKVWTIAKLHGGRLWWDDQVTSGTRFVIELPVASRHQHRNQGAFRELTVCSNRGIAEEAA